MGMPDVAIKPHKYDENPHNGNAAGVAGRLQNKNGVYSLVLGRLQNKNNLTPGTV